MATYARAFDNFVSFGANLPGQKDLTFFLKFGNIIVVTKNFVQ